MNTNMSIGEKLDHLDSILATYDPKTGTVKTNGKRVVFTMASWHDQKFIDDDEENEDFIDFVKRVEDRGAIIPDFCDTACCALGAAALNPTFNKMGLDVDDSWLIRYKTYTNDDAGTEFFGITEDESRYLFMYYEGKDLEDVTIDEVRARIAEVRANYD